MHKHNNRYTAFDSSTMYYSVILTKLSYQYDDTNLPRHLYTAVNVDNEWKTGRAKC